MTSPDLERCLTDPGYTPPVRALPGLIAALAGLPDERAAEIERVIARAGQPAVSAALGELEVARGDARAAIVSLVARLASVTRDPRCYGALVTALAEPSPECRKLAARALGKLGDSGAEAALLELLPRATGPEQKSLVEALGAVGGESSARALDALASSDTDLMRRRDRARLLIARRQLRGQGAAIAFDVALERPARVALLCRRGLEQILASELGGSSALSVDAGRVEIEHAGPLRELLRARVMLEAQIVVPIDGGGTSAADRIARTLARPEVLHVMQRWTAGVPRFRLAWSDGAHHRSLSWQVARAVSELTQVLCNDSHEALWTVHVPPSGEGVLGLSPRLDPDPRFTYRKRAVPAASHPTIAAALAHHAGVRDREVLWDPFVGSGLELIERARLGPVDAVWGTDIAEDALAAARENIAAAGIERVRLVRGSALELTPPDVSLILTNPPMGRRVARDGSVGELLESFVAHAARVLRPGGRLVWLSPLERRTARRAREVGLIVETGPLVDLGGFDARLQVLRRPTRPVSV